MKVAVPAKTILQNLTSSWSGFCLLFIALLLSGCLASSISIYQEDCNELPEMGDGGRLSVFINLEKPEVPHVNINVSLVEVLVGESWLAISEPTMDIDTEKLGKGQAFLGSRVIPSGKFERFRITVSEAYKIIDGKKSNIYIEKSAVEVTLLTPLELGFQTSAVVLLAWDVEPVLDVSMLNPLIFRASHSQEAHVVSNKVYVSCPDIDNVYVVRTDKNWVQGSFAVTGRPTYIFADSVNKRLYILAEEEAKIKIFDLISQLVIEEIKIPMSRKPVFMTMMPDNTSAFIIDDMDNVLKMDLRNGHMLARTRVGQRPVYAAYLRSQGKIVVSSTHDRSLYFIDPDTLETIESTNVVGLPKGLLEWENYLYVAEDEINRVSLFDLNQRKFEKSISVGFSPSRLTKRGDNVYLTNKLDSSISSMKGGQHYVNKTISVAGSTEEMVVAENHRLLYVGNGGCDGNLAVIDLTSNRLVSKIPLGSKPFGLTVIQ